MRQDREQIRKFGQKQIISSIKKELPSFIELFAYNISKTDMSVYSLLQKNNRKKQNSWLTLRIADHPLWLKNAQQLSIDVGSPADLIRLPEMLQRILSRSENTKDWFQMSKSQLAILYLLDKCQQNGFVWAIRLPEEIFEAFKKQPLDLRTDFMKTELFLTDRNNVNSFLQLFNNSHFQAQLAILYGRNLLFSQFSRHRLLKLLPTNQWIQPMLQKEKASSDWQPQIIYDYGKDFYQNLQKALQNEEEI
ncbi:hypothetical protein [Tetragenococcus solitarius]|uniref:Uncharacterized protein n=1 Tax=Tetragenococcus solitarius TaxID=71453 RepID=A0ABN3XZL9_9ENTE|nr:hypothetical protein [Tetragenococcus solitarius]